MSDTATATRSRTITWEDPRAVAASGAEMAGIDYMRALAAGELPPPPIAVLLNMRPTEIEHGHAVFEGEPGEEHYNPIGAEIERVRAAGEVLYRGRRQATAQAQVTDAATGKLLAHGTATCLILGA